MSCRESSRVQGELQGDSGSFVVYQAELVSRCQALKVDVGTAGTGVLRVVAAQCVAVTLLA